VACTNTDQATAQQNGDARDHASDAAVAAADRRASHELNKYVLSLNNPTHERYTKAEVGFTFDSGCEIYIWDEDTQAYFDQHGLDASMSYEKARYKYDEQIDNYAVTLCAKEAPEGADQTPSISLQLPDNESDFWAGCHQSGPEIPNCDPWRFKKGLETQ
jgi:hypothetical protein